MYGELNIKAERIIYVHGSVDPWHALGITHTRTINTVAIYIKGTTLSLKLRDTHKRSIVFRKTVTKNKRLTEFF